MAEKETKMSIKVDLQCFRCYKKIKKVLCEIRQIRDQKYDEKQNTVSITVVCCNPEKIRQMIICKGGRTVLSVDILPPPEKPKPPAPPPPPPPPPPPEPGLPVPVYPMPVVCCCPPCYGMCGGGPCYCGRKRPVKCYDGCGRPADECRGQGRQLMCGDGCGRPACQCQSGNRSCCLSRCDYFSEENATGCNIM